MVERLFLAVPWGCLRFVIVVFTDNTHYFYRTSKAISDIQGGGSVVVDYLFVVTPIVGVFNCSMFCCTLLYVHSSIAIILMGKRELVALLNLSSSCLVGWLSSSSLRCRGVVCSLWLWFFLIILTYYFRLFIASLKILGPRPSNPVAFDGSKAFVYDCTCSDVTFGMLKQTSEGILSFKNWFKLVIFTSSHLSYFHY